MHSRALVFSLVCLALLAGCATYRPAHLSADAEAAALESRSLDDPRLAEFLTTVEGAAPNQRADPSSTRSWDLGTLTLAALYFHPSLRIARARLREAQAGIRSARELPNPSLGFEDLSHTVTGPAAWTVSPVIEFLIETAGKRSKRTTEARALTQAAREDLATASWQVRGGVRDGLIAYWGGTRRLTLLNQRLDYQTQLVTLLEHRFALGEASALDVERERVATNQLRLSAESVQQQVTDARSQLAGAIGVSLKALESVKLSFDGLEAPGVPQNEPQLRRQALTERSDVQSMLANYAAAEAALALQIANQYPNLTLGPGFSFDSVRNRYILLPGMQLPVFNHNQGPIAAALARRDEAAARFTALQLQVLEQVDRAVADYRATSKALTTANALLRDEQDRARRAEQSFEAGAIDRPTYVTSQIERSIAQQDRLDALVQQRRALGALEDALESPLYFPHARWLTSSSDPMERSEKDR